MIIKDIQLKAFREANLSSFSKRMLLFVRENYGKKVAGLDDETLTKNIRAVMDLADSYGFKTEYHVMYFISLNYFHNWNGTVTDMKLLRILKAPFKPDQKLSMLKDLLKNNK